MAVLNTKKLFRSFFDQMSAAKNPSRQTITPKYALVPVRDLKPEPESQPRERKITLLNQVVEIKKKTISIEKIVNKNTKLYQKSEDKKKKLLERQKREKREEGLEAKKEGDAKEEKKVSVPGLGFLGGLKRFLFFGALAGLTGLIKDFIPEVIEKLKVIAPVYQFIEDTAKMLVGGFTDFIEKGYKLHDAIEAEVENIGGQEAVDKLNAFTDKFKDLANLAIFLFSAGVPGSVDIKPPGEDKKGGKLKTAAAGSALQPAPKTRGGPRYRMPGQAAAGRTLKENLARQQITRNKMLSPTGPKGPLDRIKRVGKGIGAQLETGTAFGGKGSGVQKAVFKAGKQAKNLSGRFQFLGGNRISLRPKGVPVIGPLLIAYDTFMQDLDEDGLPDMNVNKTLFVTGGSILGGTLASGIPIVGTILGTVIGAYIGDLMHDAILGKGPAAAFNRFITDGKKAIKGSIEFAKYLNESAGRFYNYLPKVMIPGFEIAVPSPEIFTGSFDTIGALKAALFPTVLSFPEGKVEKLVGRKIRGRSGAKRAKEAKQEISSVETTGSFGPVLDLIAKYESTNGSYESMYPGTTLPGATTMTIAEVADKATGAVGKWQNMPEYLVDRAIAVDLDPDKDLYNAENQLKIAKYLIGPGQANVTPELMRHKPDAAMLKLSKVWAAIPVPYDTQGHNRFVRKGESYYAGVGDNKAHITPEQMYNAMGGTPAYAKGGKTKGGSHLIRVGEKGPEYVLDADTTAGLEDNYPGFLDRINKADYKGSLDVLRNYASYNNPTKSVVMLQRIIIKEKVPVIDSMNNSSPYFS